MKPILWISLLIVVFLSSFVVFGPAGILVFGLIFLVTLLIVRPHTLAEWIAVLLFVFLLIALLLPPFECAREAARRNSCMNNMKQFSLALHNYAQANGCFPPAYVAEKDGRPMHSWRVLILPYLDRKDIYEQYDFNEPWDGPNNKKLLASRPRFYSCPSDGNAYDSTATKTNYAAVVGPGTAWSGGTSKTLEDLAPADQTVMLVEVTDADIPWTAPRDVEISKAASMICSKHFPKKEFFYYPTKAGVNVALADGSVHHMPGGALESDALPDLLKIGGYDVDSVNQTVGPSGRHIHWPNCFVFAVWILSTCGLLWLAVRSRIAFNAENEPGRAGGGTTEEHGEIRTSEAIFFGTCLLDRRPCYSPSPGHRPGKQRSILEFRRPNRPIVLPGEPLARWADTVGEAEHHTPGRCPGLGERLGLQLDNPWESLYAPNLPSRSACAIARAMSCTPGK